MSSIQGFNGPSTALVPMNNPQMQQVVSQQTCVQVRQQSQVWSCPICGVQCRVETFEARYMPQHQHPAPSQIAAGMNPANAFYGYNQQQINYSCGF